MVFLTQTKVTHNHDILGRHTKLDVLPVIEWLKERKAYMNHEQYKESLNYETNHGLFAATAQSSAT